MFIPLILAVSTGVFCFYYFFHRNYNRFQRLGIPCPKPIPVLGNMYPALFGRMAFAELIKTIYDFDTTARYVGTYDFTKPVIMLRDPELVKSIMIKNFDSFPDHRGFVDAAQDFLYGNNLFVLRGDRWRDMRALLSTAFTSSKMKMMFKLVSQCAIDFADFITKVPFSGSSVLEMRDAFTRYTNDVIATSAFGITVNSMKDRNNDFYVMGRDATNFQGNKVLKLFAIRCFPRLSRWLNVKLLNDKTSAFFYDVIRTTIATRDAEGIVRPDMIQLMMQSRNDDSKIDLSIEDMTAQAFVFFFGGVESSSTLMCFATHLLAVHQDVQEKLLVEIRDVLEGCEGEVTYEALHEMKYLDAVVKETLRLYPTGYLTDRVCAKSFELPPAKPGLKPFTVKPGDGIWIPCYGFIMIPNISMSLTSLILTGSLGTPRMTSLRTPSFHSDWDPGHALRTGSL